MRSAISYHLFDRRGPHCYLLPQLALNFNVWKPRTLGAAQLRPGRVVAATMPPLYAARDAGLRIDPSGWDQGPRGRWRVWVSYAGTHGYRQVNEGGGHAGFHASGQGWWRECIDIR